MILRNVPSIEVGNVQEKEISGTVSDGGHIQVQVQN